jgi:eukaryotic-like serine/threonine-protein kinase
MSKAGKGAAQLKFGRYNALTKLGQGAMATVYLAEDPSLNRMVAIKVIHSHLSSNASLLDRFTVEAKTAASLRNPNIVEIFDYGLQDNAQYLVMEYIDGPNLQFVLNLLGGQPMAPEVCAAVICQAADGLVTAEKFGVVHRDIKPENMMFKSEGVLKIADFGIAHISEQNLTQTGSILGSPNFMSPEQVEGKKPTHLTDMFSLGAVFYYCLTGRKPFSGSNIPSIMRHICDLPHEPVESLVANPDPVLVKLVDTLLAKDPAGRGKGARWLSLQLRGYLNAKGILDLTEASKVLLEATGKLGSQTVVDLTPAPGPDESLRVKEPLRPGLKLDRPTASGVRSGVTPPGTGIRPGTGVRPGTGIKPGTGTPGTGSRSSGVRPGTWQAGSASGQGSDFNGSGTGGGNGNGKQNVLLWIFGGLIAVVMLAAAVYLVLPKPAQNPHPMIADNKLPPPIPDIASVGLQPMSMELEAGQKRKFMVQISPVNASGLIRWESNDPTIAVVQDGEVWGLTAGQTTIRAISLQDSSKQAAADVIVSSPPMIPPKPEGGSGKPPHGGGTGKHDGHAAGDKDTETGKKGDKGADDSAANADSEDKAAANKTLLTVTSAPPFAEVIIDGRFVGTTPVKDKEVAPGRHKLTVSHRSFPPLDTVINLVPGEKSLRFRLFNK